MEVSYLLAEYYVKPQSVVSGWKLATRAEEGNSPPLLTLNLRFSKRSLR